MAAWRAALLLVFLMTSVEAASQQKEADAAKLAEACAFAREARSTGLLITVGGRILAEEYWPGSDAVNGLNASFPEGRTAEEATDIASPHTTVPPDHRPDRVHI